LVSKHSQAFLKFSSTDTTNDFDINNPPPRGNYGLSRIGYIHTHAIPNTKLGILANYEEEESLNKIISIAGLLLLFGFIKIG
jgi:hypothetical protein